MYESKYRYYEEETTKRFKKRSGTTNVGRSYEDLYLAYIVLKLIQDEEVDDFRISSNDESYGAFDDIVVEIPSRDQAFAFQLKHTSKPFINKSMLEGERGNFSIQKYLQSFERIRTNCKCILFTNAQCHLDTKLYLRHSQSELTLQPTKTSPELHLFQTSNTEYCYRFEFVEGNDKYQTFFDNFFLYSSQQNVRALQVNTGQLFKRMFSCSESDYDRFLNVLTEWSAQTGKKEKLNKKWVQELIAFHLLSARMQPLIFSEKEDTKFEDKTKIIKEAISQFPITVLEPSGYDNIKRFWSDSKEEVFDVGVINQIRRRYFVDSEFIADWAQVDDCNSNKILWLMDKVPLVVTEDSATLKAIQLKEKKVVLLRERWQEINLEEFLVFQNLSDLKSNKITYDYVMKNFKCSVQGKEEVSLEELFGKNQTFSELVTANDLLEMCYGASVIGGGKETLPEPHIERKLSSQDSRITLITGDPGLGKSVLLKTLKNDCPSNIWPLLIVPTDIEDFFDNKEIDENYDYESDFKDFIITGKYKTSKKLDREFYRLSLEENNVIYLWDALDEIEPKQVEAIAKIIGKLAEDNIRQYVTSRCHIKQDLERMLRTTAQDLTHFTEEEQLEYIKHRMKLTSQEVLERMNYIKTCFGHVDYKDVIKIPRQIFFLTEFLLNYVTEETISLGTIYNDFVKKIFDVYYTEKVEISFQNDKAKAIADQFKTVLKKRYGKLAVKEIFPEEFVRSLNFNTDKLVKKVKENFAAPGIIVTFDGQHPQFIHDSFKEYFAALYLWREKPNGIMNYLSRKQFSGVKTFFDYFS